MKPFTITTTHTFANTWLAWRLGAFQIDHPELAVRMTTSNDLVDLSTGEADVAIRAGRGAWEGLDQHELFKSSFTPMASPECLAEIEMEARTKTHPADLPTPHLIKPSDDWWQQWLADNGVRIDEGLFSRPGVRLDSQADEGHAAMAGQGLALLTPILWKGDVAARRLCTPFPDKISTRGWAYWLVYPKERRNVPKVKRFRECGSRAKCSARLTIGLEALAAAAALRTVGRPFDRGSCGKPLTRLLGHQKWPMLIFLP